MSGSTNRDGVISRGIVTPVIQPGDDLQEIVISCVERANGGEFCDSDIIGVTEAVVAISQKNFVSHQNITDDISRKFEGATTLVVVDPIQSRNRFMDALKAIAKTPTLSKIIIAMTYPSDEVGNQLVSNRAIRKSGVNPYVDILTKDEFCEKVGEPKHIFTGKNYIAEYENACEGKAEVILCNDFSKLVEYTGCEDYLVCSIHRRQETVEDLEAAGAKRILTLADIMSEPIDGSGYNSDFGLYGTNLMKGDRLKLMPRDCEEFVKGIQEKILEKYGKKVEVFVYGDGAFKDPVGGIWELADPVACLASTSGLKGTPKEVKLKLIASEHEDKSAEEIAAIVAEERAKRKATEDVTGENSLGTTPRRITDLLASLADLTTGSGDRCTPVVYIQNYL